MAAPTIHTTALIENSVTLGDDTRIWHHCHIREGTVIGQRCNLGKNVYIDTGVRIGDETKIQNNVSVFHGVALGRRVFIGPSAVFTNDLTPRAFLWDATRVVKTRVGDGASIGANATIVCGVTIGEYAMVGAGSVVTRDIPAFCLAYGNPARLQGYVCICGHRLPAPDTAAGRHRCEHCGSRLRITPGQPVQLLNATV